MKEISVPKKLEVIQLFFSGYTYDEIVLKLGIAKGSVVNIIEAFRSGELQIAPNEYIDALRELVVDIRKQHTSVKKLQMYSKIDHKVVEMGVEIDEVDDWLDIAHDIATEPAAMKPFVSAALEMSQMEMETGLDCANLVAEYKNTSQALNNLKAEMANTIELKKKADAGLDATIQAMKAAQADLDDYMAQKQVSWDKVNTVLAILEGESSLNRLSKKEKGEISKRIAETGSLISYNKGLSEENTQLEEHILLLQEDKHNLDLANTGLHMHNDQLASQVYAMMEEEKVLGAQMKEIKWQLKGLKTAKAGHALDIYTAWLMLEFLKDPSKVDNEDFDWLVETLNGVRLARLGKEPKQAVDAMGNIICQCHVPAPYTELKDYNVAMDEVRQRLAEYLVLLVKDKFVPKFEYETNKKIHEIIEMNKQLVSIMFGQPDKPDQLELSEHETATEEIDPDEKPDKPVNANTVIPKESAVTGVFLDYSPEAIKAKMEMEKKFRTKIGPRIDFSIPWENGQ